MNLPRLESHVVLLGNPMHPEEDWQFSCSSISVAIVIVASKFAQKLDFPKKSMIFWQTFGCRQFLMQL